MEQVNLELLELTDLARLLGDLRGAERGLLGRIEVVIGRLRHREDTKRLGILMVGKRVGALSPA